MYILNLCYMKSCERAKEESGRNYQLSNILDLHKPNFQYLVVETDTFVKLIQPVLTQEMYIIEAQLKKNMKIYASILNIRKERYSLHTFTHDHITQPTTHMQFKYVSSKPMSHHS